MKTIIAAAGAVLALAAAQALAAEPFALSSSTFKDATRLSLNQAGNQAGSANCVGKNISPAFNWANTPAATKSLAFVVFDPDGGLGLGAVHFVAYGISPATHGFAEGELAQESAKSYVHGKGSGGLSYFMGPCPPPGTTDHHYGFDLMATDLAPDALPPGLTRDELLAKLKGHVLAGSGMVALFRHP